MHDVDGGLFKMIETGEDMARKLRVGIIMGGLSSEKEVSLESGRNIFSKIDRAQI